MNTDNIDRFGHCVVCHMNLITKRVVDGKVVEMFMPIHAETTFLLDNGSQMKVCMCKPCQEKTDLQDPVVQANIMEAVQKGWELETKILVADEKLPEWTQEYADKYLAKMSELAIDCHSEDLAANVIQERIKELVCVKPIEVAIEVKGDGVLPS